MPIYERRGGDVLVNTTTANHQDNARIAYLADGRFVVAWRDWSATGGDTSGQAIRARIFNADGTPATGEFLANTTTEGYQKGTVLFALASGGFAIAWTDTRLDGSDSNIVVQIFDAAGAKAGGEILVNSHLAGEQSTAAGTALADGGFVLTWTDITAEPAVSGTGNSPIGVRAQRFDAAGAKVGGEVAVNTATLYEQSEPSIAALAGGGWVIVWKDLGTLNGIVGQRFAADGSRAGGEFMVSTVTASTQTGASVAALAGGGFVVAWTDYSQIGGDGSYTGVKAQLFDSAGVRVGGEFLVNTATSGYQQYAFVTAMPGGGFLVTWSSTTGSVSGDGSGSAVKGQYFDSAGAREGGEFLVNASTGNDQLGAGAAVGTDMVVAVYVDFSGGGGDSSGSSVKLTRFIVAPGTEGADGIVGTEAQDEIHGLGGDDALFGLGGHDLLDGGEGEDGLEGGAGNDDLIGGGGNDNLFGGEGLDLLLGGEGDDRLEGEAGNDYFEDGAGSDLMIGGEGDDEFHHVADSASADEDVAVGEAGADTLSLDYRNRPVAVQLDSVEPDAAGGYSGAVFSGSQFLFSFFGIETLLIQGSQGDDTLVAGGGNDLLMGNAGNDVLTGGGGHDLIVGSAGADWMSGGAGDDVYQVDGTGDAVVEGANEGVDYVQTTLPVYTLPDNVEWLRGMAPGHTLIGNALDNTILGSGVADTLDGGAGADRMAGGDGNDIFIVDNVGDLVEDGSGTADEIRTSLAVYSLQNLTLIENLTGTLATAQSLTGNASANALRGGAGDDVLDGAAGGDRMMGGAGNDLYSVDSETDVIVEAAGEGVDEIILLTPYYTMPDNVENVTAVNNHWHVINGNSLDNVLRGSTGSDHLRGGGGKDTLIGGQSFDTYQIDSLDDVIIEEEDPYPNSVGDTVQTSLTDYTLRADLENLSGMTPGSRLVGNDGDNEILSAGGSTLIGGKGNDRYRVRQDDVVIELEGEGIDQITVAIGNWTLGDTFENLTGDSTAGQVLTGNRFANRILASWGNDIIDGAAGADHMEGNYGNDVYLVDDPGDVVVEETGRGTDEVRTALASYTLAANVEKFTGLAASGQSVHGNSLGNIIAGGAGDDVIEGLGGNDTLSGGAGDDDLFGGTGNDVLNGFDPGSDDFHGGDGNDTITLRQGAGGSWVNAWGDAGDDRIVVDQLVGRATVEGGDGADTIVLIDAREAILTLGAGADIVDLSTFATGAVNATVRIADFASWAGEDRVEFSQWLTTHLIAWDGVANPFRTGHLRLIQYGADVLLQVDKNGGGNGYRDLLVFANQSVTTFTAANLDGLAPPFVTGTAAAETFTGTLGHDIIIGAGGNDLFLMQHGGRDWVFGDEGNDTFYFGPILHGNVDIIPARILGGVGSDTLVLQGTYSTLFVGGGLASSEIGGVETIKLLSGDDSTYAPAGYTIDIYDIMFANGAIPPGETLTIDAAGLKAGERTRVNGRADLNANLVFLGGAGADEVYGTGGETRLSGGGGDDQLYAGKGDSVLDGGEGGDKVTGGAGDDLLQGGAGADRIYDWSFVDGGGSDRFEGGAGNDYLSVTRDDNDVWTTLALDGGGDDDEIVLLLDGGGLDGGGLVTVDGGDGNDLISIVRVLGNVTITLGAGQDQVGLSYLHGLNRPGTQTVVTDFVTGDGGDRLDWALMLKYDLAGYTEGQNPFVTGHARLVQDGADTLLEIDKRSGVSNLATVRFQNHQVADFNTFNMGGFAPRVSLGSAGADVVMGTAGADRFDGLGGADLFRLGQGGADIALGGAGNDAFVFGSQLTALDQADGGDGKDQLGLQGNYNLVLGAQNLVNVETLALLPGSDARFGDTSGALYSYNLTTVDANVAAGQLLNVNSNTLRAGENVVFDGSAETNGGFFFFAGLGIDQLRGGAGGDGFFFGTGRFTADDRINGGAGADQVGLRGDYAGGVTLQAATLVNVETLAFLSAADTRFGGGGTLFGYFVTSHDGNVAAGQRLSVNGAQLMTGESMRFDGRAELDGTFRILAGKGDDILTGGAQADFFYGNFGKDVLEGRGGADTFLYRFAGESAGLGFDQLVGFDHRVDRIDLPVATSFVGSTAATVREASFDADLAAALQTLGAGQARIVNVQAGDMAGRMFVVADGNGAAGYQAGQDFVIELLSPPVMPVAGDPFFI